MDRERIARSCVCCGGASLARSPAILMPFVAHRALGWEPVVVDDSWGLKSIKPGHAYTVCNSLSCKDCDLLFLDIRFSQAELQSLYEGYRGEEYTALRERYEPGYRARNQGLVAGVGYLGEIENFLRPYLPTHPRVLDWGGDTGKNTPFRSIASVLHIYDISNQPVIAGAVSVSRETALRTKYDLVVCAHVLEHLPFPSDHLADLAHAMSPDTVLYIEVPYEELVREQESSGRLHLKKKHWHEHVNFFTEKSLASLVKRAGMEVLAIERLSVVGGGSATHVFQVACRKSR